MSFWEFLDNNIQSLVAVIGMLLAGWVAFAKIYAQKKLDRYYDFYDERLKIYSEFLRQINESFSSYLFAAEETPPFEDRIHLADKEAKELDTLLSIIELTCPSEIVESCILVNSDVQRMNDSLTGLGQSNPVLAHIWVKHRRGLIDAMKVDIDSIEVSGDRRKYEQSSYRQVK